MKIPYDNNLDRMREQAARDGKDTSIIDSIISLYQMINMQGIDSSNIASKSIGTSQLKDESVTSAKMADQESWHEVGSAGEPAFQSSWVNLGGGAWSTCAYYKDTMGEVHLKGVVANGQIHSTNPIFTLPAGYRPNQSLILSPCSYSTQYLPSRLTIHATGEVCAEAGGNTFYCLDGVTFLAEQ